MELGLRQSCLVTLDTKKLLGRIECVRCRLLLPMCAVSVHQYVRPFDSQSVCLSVCLSRGTRLHCAWSFGAAFAKSLWPLVMLSTALIASNWYYFEQIRRTFETLYWTRLLVLTWNRSFESGLYLASLWLYRVHRKRFLVLVPLSRNIQSI